jgi:single-strand DNA-binding protein
MKLIGNGRIWENAEIRNTSTGHTTCELNMSFSYGRKGEDGFKPTQWIKATLWGAQAERMAPYLLKGTVVFVCLRDVHIETFEGKNGQGHKLVGTVDSIDFVPKSRDEPTQHMKDKADGYAPKNDIDDVDLPF